MGYPVGKQRHKAQLPRLKEKGKVGYDHQRRHGVKEALCLQGGFSRGIKTVYGLHIRRAPAVIYPVQHLKHNPEGEHRQSQADPCLGTPIRLKAAELKAGDSLPSHKKEAEKPPQVNQVACLPVILYIQPQGRCN